MWWWLAACSEPAPRECGPEECARHLAPAPPVTAGLAPWEEALVGPLLADAREGIRPWDDRGIGICRGPRGCAEYLGTDVGELPPGDYLVRAELRVPDLGTPGTWAVSYRASCEVTTLTKDGSTRKKTESTRLDQAVRYAGPDQGWRIEPLQVIRSPAEGATTCTWSLEAKQPSGVRQWSGSWSTPAPEVRTAPP